MFIKATKKGWIALIVLPLLLLAVVLGARPALRAYFQAVYPVKYWDTVVAEAEKNELDPALVLAIIRTESRFKPEALSGADAHGLMQVTPITLKWAQYRSPELKSLQTENLFDPHTNIRVGTYVLALLLESYPETDTALAAYNAGFGHVAEWLADDRYSADGKTLHTIPFSETAQYVKKVNHALTVYQELYDWL
ncbi:MAG: lytic transglycosylase domain-containing protein [Clostridia bacterium]|nr:lytic transglycosylase domain-containing protein [Clostridia bacterium]